MLKVIKRKITDTNFTNMISTISKSQMVNRVSLRVILFAIIYYSAAILGS